MALGALLSAYQEDDRGGLRALLPLAGRTIVEYQARCAAAAGAQPIVVLAEHIPLSLDQAFARLRDEGIIVTAVHDGAEAAARFEPGALVLHFADGLAPHMVLVRRLAEADEPALATVPDDEEHAAFERIDAANRWAGLSLVDARLIGSTAAMLGDWDLQSTLLRRAVQAGARLLPVGAGASPLLAASAAQTAGFERHLLRASRAARVDWPSRYLLPLVEEFATERLLPTRVRPSLLVQGALALTLASAFALTRGWLWPALGLLLAATPLELIAERLAMLRMKPLPAAMVARRLLRPAAGLALVALGWFETRHGGGWGALVAAFTTAAFAQAAAIERPAQPLPGGQWLFSPRGAVWAMVPFAVVGWWSAGVAVLALWAAASFFLVQHARHHAPRD